EILEKLDWIKGVRVQVQVTSPRAALAAVSRSSGGAAPKPAGAGEDGMNSRPVDTGARSGQTDARPASFVNKAADLEGEPGVSSKPAPARAVVLDGENASHANAAGGLPHRDRGRERGRVLIHVPRSFYYYADLRTDHREPSREDLRAMADRTEKQIRAA